MKRSLFWKRVATYYLCFGLSLTVLAKNQEKEKKDLKVRKSTSHSKSKASSVTSKTPPPAAASAHSLETHETAFAPTSASTSLSSNKNSKDPFDDLKGKNKDAGCEVKKEKPPIEPAKPVNLLNNDTGCSVE